MNLLKSLKHQRMSFMTHSNSGSNFRPGTIIDQWFITNPPVLWEDRRSWHHHNFRLSVPKFGNSYKALNFKHFIWSESWIEVMSNTLWDSSVSVSAAELLQSLPFSNSIRKSESSSMWNLCQICLKLPWWLKKVLKTSSLH